MSENEDRQVALSHLAQEFAELSRRGSRVSVEEFAAAHPLHANDIRELFPALVMLESMQQTSSELSGELAIPNQFGKYRILRKIGEGGMGQVYEAIQQPLGRQVALKVLRKAVVKPRLKQRFAREARVLEGLHHANIVSLYEFGKFQGIQYFAMQFVEGKSLDNFLHFAMRRRRKNQRSTARDVVSEMLSGSESAAPLSLAVFDRLLSLTPREYQRQIAILGARLAEALAEAHRSGVLHRDVKPANILIDQNMDVWLADFGLAFVEGDSDITTVGDVFGTLRYLPPERFQGKTDPRGDVYSLGITLYEMLAQQAVFSGVGRAELIHKILNDPPVPLRSLNPLISSELETIVHRAIAHEMVDRYQSAGEFAQELSRFYRDERIRTRRWSNAKRIARICRRNPLIASMGGAIFLLLILVVIVSVSASIRLQTQLSQTLAAERVGKERLYDSLLIQASVIRKSDETGRRFRALTILQDASAVAQQLGMSKESRQVLRDEAIAALCLADAIPGQPIEAWPIGAAALDFDPNCERYARMNTAGEIAIFRTADNRQVDRIPGLGTRFSANSGVTLRFSPDGHWLLQWLRGEEVTGCLRLWDVTSTPARMTAEWSDQIAGFYGFTPDSRHVAIRITNEIKTSQASQGPVETAPFQIRFFSVESSLEALTPIETTAASVLAFHPRMDLFAISDEQKVRIVDVVSQRERAQWPLQDVTHLLFSSDGETLFAATRADARVHRWNVAGQCEQQSLRNNFPESITQLISNHRGDTLITTSQFELQAWEIPSRRLLWQSGSQMGNLRFSLDDKCLAAIHRADPKVSVLELANSAAFKRIATDLSPSERDVVEAILHPTRSLFAAPSADGIILWDLERGQQCGLLPGKRVPICFDSEQSLLTYTELPEGLQRWQLKPATSATQSFTKAAGEAIYWVDGENQRHQLVGGPPWSASRDGRVLAMPAHSEGAFVYTAADTDSETANRFEYRRLHLGPQHDVNWTSVSPDGKWVATGSSRWFAGDTDPVSVTVWDATSGERYADLLTGNTGVPKFSADGRWLSILSGGYPGGVRWWDVDTWQPCPEPQAVIDPGGVAYCAWDPAHGLLAVQGGFIRVLNVGTAREAFRLMVDQKTSLAPQFFTADGSHLVGVDYYSGEILIWNLEMIFQQMRSLGLDR